MPQVISRRWIVLGIVGAFLTGWLIFAFTTPRDPVIDEYLLTPSSRDDYYVFRSDGGFIRLSGPRQLAAGRWEFRKQTEVPIQGFEELSRVLKSLPAREYTLLTETFEPGQHTPDRVLLVGEPGYLLADGVRYYREPSWFQRLQARFLNWIQ